MSGAPDEPRDELLGLVGELRAQLTRHASAGAWGASAAPTSRPAREVPEPAVALDDAAAPAAPRRSLAQVRADLGECTRCALSTSRHSIVFGVGAEHAPLVFVGEAPGADEDRLGEPFVGRAGELLDKMILAMGWRRQDVYIANVLKCRPPNNRTPTADEIAACRPFLDAQLRSLAPRIVVALGRPAANTLLGLDAPISTLRGRIHEARGLRIVPTFHPAYLLREPERKREAWADLKVVMAELARLGIQPPVPPAGS